MRVLILKFLFSIFCIMFTFSIYAQKDPVLLSIEGENITRSEFFKIFNKNNIKGEAVTKQALEEYLELYINFKLKVKEAEMLGLDTLNSFKNELEGYRMQLAQPYFLDKKVDSLLALEAYDRMLWDIRASHILIRVDANAIPEDTLEKYNEIMALRKRILKGESFEKVAAEESDDQSARDHEATENRPFVKGNAGDLGYFTVFDLVYPFETAAYNLKIGEVSMPVRSDFGYHLIKLYDKKKALGKVQVAHILINIPEGSTAADSLKIKLKADSLYNAILAGAKFDEIARVYSDDKGSAGTGGVLPWFGAFRMVPEFIASISKLENKGDMPKPVLTSFGWHIIELKNKKGIGSFEEELPDIKARIENDNRSNLSRIGVINRIKKDYNFTENKDALYDFYKVVSDSILVGKWEAEEAAGLTKLMFKIGNKSYYQPDFTKLITQKQIGARAHNVGSFLNYSYKNWVDEKCIEYEDENLENKDADFKALMKEYRDGILLFDLTDKKVWTKAVKDTIGLNKVYEANKYKFMWNERVTASIYTCANEQIAKQTRKILKKADKKNISNDSLTRIINVPPSVFLEVKTGKFQKGDNEIIDKLAWKKGISQDMKIDNRIVFVKITELLPSQPKKLREVKGIMTADYQKQLDEEWIKELRSKYKYSIDVNVLNSMSTY